MSRSQISREKRHFAVARGGGFVDSFRRDLERLDADGFADWLVRSFCGPAPEPVPGWFHSDSDELFGQLFRRAEPHFDDAMSSKAVSGVTRAIRSFVPEIGTPYGLLELAGVVEAVGADHLLPDIAGVLGRWFDPEARVLSRTLETRDDVIAFRETLECAFRLLPARRADLPAGGGDFRPLADWSHGILLRHPHALNRAFVPAYAPLYMLALCSDVDDDQRELFDSVLRNGWRTQEDLFPELFVFKSEKIPGALFPYHFDRLSRMADNFLDEEFWHFSTEQGFDSFGDMVKSATLGSPRGEFNRPYHSTYLQTVAD